MKWYLEERMKCLSASVDGRYARWGKNDVLLLRRAIYVAQECRLTCTSLARKEQRILSTLNDVERILELLVGEVYFLHSYRLLIIVRNHRASSDALLSSWHSQWPREQAC